MDSNSAPSDEVIIDIPSVFRIYKDGRADRYLESPFLPASNDPDETGIRSKDVEISPENNVSARLFLPKTISKDEKLPVLIYIHGGAFVIGLAPEHPIPTCFEDSWATVKWVMSHSIDRQGPEPWINDHADFTRVFFVGDSAGGTITKNMVARASVDGIEDGVNIVGMILVHPFFGCGQIENLWEILCSDKTGPEDPRLNPMAHPNLLSGFKCSKVLIFTAGKDFLKDRGLLYYEALKKSGWGGQVEIVESEGEDHAFHLKSPNCENANIMMKRTVSFLKE